MLVSAEQQRIEQLLLVGFLTLCAVKTMYSLFQHRSFIAICLIALSRFFPSNDSFEKSTSHLVRDYCTFIISIHPKIKNWDMHICIHLNYHRSLSHVGSMQVEAWHLSLIPFYPISIVFNKTNIDKWRNFC